jgi:hypothetical protein
MKVHEKNRRLGCGLMVPPMDNFSPPPISHINVNMEAVIQQLHHEV